MTALRVRASTIGHSQPFHRGPWPWAVKTTGSPSKLNRIMGQRSTLLAVAGESFRGVLGGEGAGVGLVDDLVERLVLFPQAQGPVLAVLGHRQCPVSVREEAGVGVLVVPTLYVKRVLLMPVHQSIPPATNSVRPTRCAQRWWWPGG